MGKFFTAVLLASVGLTGGCQNKPEGAAKDVQPTHSSNITAALGDAADLSVARRLIGRAQLGPALESKGSYTVFLPIDQAWSALKAEDLKALESDEGRPDLIAVLRQHIASGYLLPGDLEKGVTSQGAVMLASMGTAPIKVRRDGNSFVVGDGAEAPRIIGTPIKVGNDVFYRIDRLIPPPT